MEKTQKFQIVYAARTNLCKQANCPREIPYETVGFPQPKQSEYVMHGLSNILKLQATFLYSIYQQRPGKTNLFHMRGGQFHAGNMLCTFNIKMLKNQN